MDPVTAGWVSADVCVAQQPPEPAELPTYMRVCHAFTVPKRQDHPPEQKRKIELGKGKPITLPTHAPGLYESENPYALLKVRCCCLCLLCSLMAHSDWAKAEAKAEADAIGRDQQWQWHEAQARGGCSRKGWQ